MEKVQSEKMGKMPIPKLMFKMSAPAILSMLVQSLYNIVDSIFVSRYSQVALNALSIAFPMQIFIMAFALGIGVGTGCIISRKLGEGNVEDASKTAKNGLFVALVLSIFFAVFGYFITVGFALLFAPKGSETYTYVVQYLSICTCVSFGFFFEIYATKVMQATGNMVIPMVTQLIGAIINIVLDPILIFGICGLKPLGVIGAAIATVFGEFVAMVFAMFYLFKLKGDLDISVKGFKPEKRYIKDIIRNGLPVTIMNSVSAFATLLMNLILNAISSVAVTVLGVYFKLQSFVFMPIFGLSQGAMPIMGYNFGLRDKKRFNKAYNLSLFVSIVIMSLGLLVFQIWPAELLKLFHADKALLEVGVPALRIISLSFIPAAFGITIGNMFQSIGHSFKSMVMSLLRQVIVLLPVAYMFSKLTPLKYVWYSYPISDLVDIMIFIPISIVVVKKAFKNTTPTREFESINTPVTTYDDNDKSEK